MKKAARKEKKWSRRPREWFVEEQGLRALIRDIEGLIAAAKARLAHEEGRKARVFGPPAASVTSRLILKDALQEIATVKAEIESLEEKEQGLRAQAEALQSPPGEQVKARHKTQDGVARSAMARLKLDGEIDRAIGKLRELLQCRDGLTEAMRDAARTITLQGDLDKGRYEDLERALPVDSLAESREWTGWFLGDAQLAREYIVVDESLDLSESLVHCGMHKFGETVCVGPRKAAELLRRNRPAHERERPWELLPPSLMTPEDFREMSAEAAEIGYGVEFYWKISWQVQNEGERRKFEERHPQAAPAGRTARWEMVNGSLHLLTDGSMPFEAAGRFPNE